LAAATATATGGSSEVLQALAPTRGGLTTEQVIERAIATAPSVMKAEAELATREYDASVAFLGFAPRIDTMAGYTRLSPVVPDDPLLAMVFPKIENTYALRASVSLPVSDWFLVGIARYSATFLAEEAATLQTRATQEAVAFRAVETFLNAVRARAAEVVVQRSVDVLAANHADLVNLANAGVITEGDALQVKAQLASARVQLEQTKGLVEVTREALRRSIHSEEVVLEHGEDLLGLVARPAPEMKEALHAALAERAEVRALERVVEAREKAVTFTFGRVFPQLTVDGQAEYAKPNQRTFYDPENFNGTWSVGVNLAWSPNDSIQAWSESNKAEQDVVAAKADLADLSDAIAVEVANAVSTYRATRESIGAAQEAVDAAQGTFADRQNLLNAGGGTTRELLLSEQDLRRAQLQLINAHLDLRLAQARLDRALGRLVKEAKP
jgi:outer membrane protein TolC